MNRPPWIAAAAVAALALALAACSGPRDQKAEDRPQKWQPYVSVGVGAGF